MTGGVVQLVAHEHGEGLDRERGVDALEDVQQELIGDVVGAFDDQAPEPLAQRE